jgi:hypothetical protein
MENLRKWQEIVAQASSGQLSNSALSERFEREIVPFWESASARLKKDEATLPAGERQYASMVAEYSRLRLEWARALADGAGGNQDRFSDAARYEKDGNRLVAQITRVVLLASLDHRPRALANSPWIVGARNWFTGQRWKCVEPPTSLGGNASQRDSLTDGPAVRQAAGCKAQKLFLSGDYTALDALLEQSAGSLADLPDGGSTLDGVVRGLSNLLDYGTSDLVQMLGRTADWRRELPNSVYPQLIESLIFEQWAWTARGQGAASSISPQTWAIFAQRTEMAAMGLREIVARANTNPLWYELSLDVGLDESKPVDELRSTFRRGLVEAPDYWPLYARMLRILMPRWYGSEEDIRRLIYEVSTRPNGDRDFVRYARMYWSYSSLEDDKVALFNGSLAVWSTMREGFEELQYTYPQSDVILNAYAKFACMAQDGASYANIRPKLRDRLSSVAWSEAVSLKHCDEEFPAAAAAARGHTFTPPRVRLSR